MFIVAFIVLVLAALGGSRRSSALLRADTRPLALLMKPENQTPAKLRAGAIYATGIGYLQAARVLRERADFVENVQQVAALLNEAQPYRATSPFPEIDDARWLRFVKACQLPAEERQGREWLIGVFGFAPRTLAKLGIMTDVVRDGDGWVGRWTDIVPQHVFNSSLPAQVQALTAISSLHRAETGDIVAPMIGQEIEGKTVSLSGLLAVALRAGGRVGMESWLNNGADRRKFKLTTAAFHRANGIF